MGGSFKIQIENSRLTISSLSPHQDYFISFLPPLFLKRNQPYFLCLCPFSALLVFKIFSSLLVFSNLVILHVQVWFPESLGRLLEVPESQLIAVATVLNQIQKTLVNISFFGLLWNIRLVFICLWAGFFSVPYCL